MEDSSFATRLIIAWMIVVACRRGGWYANAHAVEVGESVVLVKEPKPGWVRFCSGEKRFDIFSNQCQAGFFWKPDFKVDENGWQCVCSRGAWRRSSKWCSAEDVPRFVHGDVTCFVPEKNIEGMFYLGDQYSAWDSGDPVLLSSYKSGFTVKGDDFEKKWKLAHGKNDDAGILIVRPRDDWTVEDQNNPNMKLCLRAPIPSFSEEIDGIYIYNISLFSNKEKKASEFKLVFTRTCFSWKKDDGKKWYEIVGESIDDKNMIMEKYSNETASDECRSCMSVPIPEAPKTDVYGKPLKGPEKKTVYDLKNVAVLTSEINLQSERLGLYWTNRLLRKDTTDYAKGEFQELEILEKAAVLAYGACNMKYIPKEFYQYFLVMFRKLLSESFQKYAPVSPINTEYYKKIQDLLEQCRKRTKPIQFVVDKGCPEKYSKYQEYKNENGTLQPIPKGNDYNAEPAKHDYLLEFVWRLKSFLHYQCFPEFKDDSVLHDLIQNQLESLFTEDILLRWFNPSMAFRMYDHIFKTTIDLKTTMNNFEKCVRVVHDVNKFPVWLKRVIDQPHRVQQSLFAKKRRRRAVDEEQDGLEGAESLESEFTDMAIENIREKRTDDSLSTTDNYSESTTATGDSTSTTLASEEMISTTASGDMPTATVSSEELTPITTISSEKNTTVKNKATTISSSIETTLAPKSPSIEGTTQTPADVTTSSEETTQTPKPSSAEDVMQMPATNSGEDTTPMPIVPSVDATTHGPVITSGDKTTPAAEGITSTPAVSSSEETTTTSTPGTTSIQITTPAPGSVTAVSDDEIRWKRENSGGTSGEDSSKSDSSVKDDETTTMSSTTEENGNEPEVKADEVNEEGSDESPVPKGKTSSELNSIEAMYIDSAEEEAGGRPREGDKVWNKFTVSGVKGFVGACIDSMHTFTKESKRNLEECW